MLDFNIEYPPQNCLHLDKWMAECPCFLNTAGNFMLRFERGLIFHWHKKERNRILIITPKRIICRKDFMKIKCPIIYSQTNLLIKAIMGHHMSSF